MIGKTVKIDFRSIPDKVLFLLFGHTRIEDSRAPGMSRATTSSAAMPNTASQMAVERLG